VILVGLGPPDSGAGAGYVRGLSLSPDGGQRWFGATEPNLSQADIVPAIAFSESTPTRAFASGFGKGLFSSSDSGATWSPYPVPGAEQRFFEALLAVPVSEGCELLYAGGQNGLFARNILAVHETVFVPLAGKRAVVGP
jgi:hypothetical protein